MEALAALPSRARVTLGLLLGPHALASLAASSARGWGVFADPRAVRFTLRAALEEIEEAPRPALPAPAALEALELAWAQAGYSLGEVERTDITELKSFSVPPAATQAVLHALRLVFGQSSAGGGLADEEQQQQPTLSDFFWFRREAGVWRAWLERMMTFQAYELGDEALARLALAVEARDWPSEGMCEKINRFTGKVHRYVVALARLEAARRRLPEPERTLRMGCLQRCLACGNGADGGALMRAWAQGDAETEAARRVVRPGPVC